MTEEYERYCYEQARAWLEHIRRLGIEVESAQAMVESERALLDGVHGIDYTREHVAGTPPIPDIADLVDRLFDHIRDYTANLSAYTDERRKAFVLLEKIPDAKERNLLIEYYLLGKTWSRIQMGLGFSWQGTMKLRRRAILSAYDVMPTEWRDPRPTAL